MTVVSSGQISHVSAGQVDSGIVVQSGGVLIVDAGGTASGTIINLGGSETVLGTDIGAVVGSGGTGSLAVQNVSGGGVASNTAVIGGQGFQAVLSGGRAVSGLVGGNNWHGFSETPSRRVASSAA